MLGNPLSDSQIFVLLLAGMSNVMEWRKQLLIPLNQES